MKTVKRILAIIGIIVLLGLYAAAFFFALTDDPNSMNYFLAAIAATVIVPALLWAYGFIYDILKKYYGPDRPAEKDEGKGESPAEK